MLREALRQKFSLGDLLSLSKKECQTSGIVLEGQNVLWSKIFELLDIPLPQRWSVSQGLPPMHLAQLVWPEVSWAGQDARVFYAEMLVWAGEALQKRYRNPQLFVEALLHLPWGTRGDFAVPLEGTGSTLTLRVLVGATLAMEDPQGLSRLQVGLSQGTEPSRESLARYADSVWCGMMGADPLIAWRTWEESYYRTALLREMQDPLCFLETYMHKERILGAPLSHLDVLLKLPNALTSKAGLLKLLTTWQPEDPLVQHLSEYWQNPRLLLWDLRDGKEPAKLIPPRVLAFLLGLSGDYYDRRPGDLHVRVARMIDYLED